VLQREYVVIREGETDLRADMWLRRESAQSGQPIDIFRRRKILQQYSPPQTLDFRLFAITHRPGIIALCYTEK
jgi:hypothetical protein